MMNASAPGTLLDKLFKLSLTLAATALLIWMLGTVAGFLWPIILLVGLSLILTYILLAPVNGLEWLLKKGGQPLYHALPEKLQRLVPGHLSRVLSILLMYWLTLIIFLFIGFRFGPLVWTELVMFGKQVPAYVERAEDWLLDQPLLSQYFRKEIKAADEEAALIGDPQNGNTLKPVPPPPIARPPLASAPTVEDSADTLEPLRDTSLTEDEKKQAKAHVLNWSERLDEFEPFLKENLNNTVGHVSNLVGTTLSMVVYGLTLLVMVFYFLLDGSHLIKDGLIKSLPASAKPTTAYFLERFHAVMFGFVKT
ncbi:MAG: AI-2E family transporter, partial [Cyanobacteria bacterium HKST-UBA05]|nr:AI-2E family transporter [Cyanobacteria bacterium HKST-UBA05]